MPNDVRLDVLRSVCDATNGNDNENYVKIGKDKKNEKKSQKGATHTMGVTYARLWSRRWRQGFGIL